MKTHSNGWERAGGSRHRQVWAGLVLLVATGMAGSGCAVVDAFDNTQPVSPPPRRLAKASTRPVAPGLAARSPAYSIVDRPEPAVPQTKPAAPPSTPWVERTPSEPPVPVPELPPTPPQIAPPMNNPQPVPPAETVESQPPEVIPEQPPAVATQPAAAPATLPTMAKAESTPATGEAPQAIPLAPAPDATVAGTPPVATAKADVPSAPATARVRTPEQQKVRDKITALKTQFEKGVDINEKDESGRTLLQQAAIAGELETVELLLDWGANVKAVDRQGWSALHWAASCGNQEICELLIASGSPVNARGYLDETPLYWAAVFDRRDTVALLLARGAEVNTADKRGKTPLHAAIEGDARGTATVLLAHGANVKAVDEAGLTPLHQVVLQLRKTLLALSESEASPAPDATVAASTDRKQQRRSALSSAGEMVKLLLKNEADVNAVTPGGVTPLHLAAWDDTTEVATVLLAAGANPAAKDTRGRTPADYAKQRGQDMAAAALASSQQK